MQKSSVRPGEADRQSAHTHTKTAGSSGHISMNIGLGWAGLSYHGVSWATEDVGTWRHHVYGSSGVITGMAGFVCSFV